MEVALVYNVKKEELVSSTDEQPSSRIATTNSTSQVQLSGVDDYAEWDTIETIHAVRDALALHHSVELIEADHTAFEKLQQSRPEIVFNIAEGRFGASREAQMPAIFEMLNIPYTGSDPLTLAICLDKSRAKEILSFYNISTPRFAVIDTQEDLQNHSFDFPVMVKPLFEGSSKGIFDASLVQTREELIQQVEKVLSFYKQPVLVEDFLPGREFTVAMLGTGDHVSVFPIVEIKFDSLPANVNPIYSYEAKWIWDQSENPLDIFECPARIPDELKVRIEQVCKKAFKVLRCRDWSRIDVRLDKQGNPNIIEINPLPGILPKIEDNSCFPKAARMAGLNYQEMLNSVLNAAIHRYGLAK
jgi:D-alanine-D-alanine ligase